MLPVNFEYSGFCRNEGELIAQISTGFFVTGTLSPVNIDSSTVTFPQYNITSHGRIMLGLTIILSPGTKCSSDISTILPLDWSTPTV